MAAADILTRIGRLFYADGVQGFLRGGSNGELITAEGKGKYAESSMRSNIFVCSTAVAGVAPGTAISTTPPFDLHNPANSGVEVSILRVTVGYVSGTLGAGSLIYTRNTQETVPSGGTSLTEINARLGVAAGQATCGQGRTIDATPTIIRPSGLVLGASLASTAALPVHLQDDIDGEITVPEGQSFCVEGVAAGGSSPLIMIGVTWQEIPTS